MQPDGMAPYGTAPTGLNPFGQNPDGSWDYDPDLQGDTTGLDPSTLAAIIGACDHALAEMDKVRNTVTTSGEMLARSMLTDAAGILRGRIAVWLSDYEKICWTFRNLKTDCEYMLVSMERGNEEGIYAAGGGGGGGGGSNVPTGQAA